MGTMNLREFQKKYGFENNTHKKTNTNLTTQQTHLCSKIPKSLPTSSNSNPVYPNTHYQTYQSISDIQTLTPMGRKTIKRTWKVDDRLVFNEGDCIIL